MTTSKDVLIVVISGNYSTGLGLVRSLGSAGYKVDLISTVKRKGSSLIASSSKYVRNSAEIFMTGDDERDQKSILDKIKEYRKETGFTKILIPADDRSSFILDDCRDELKEDFIIAGYVNDGEKRLSSLMDKAVQGKAASEFGLKRPEEWMIDLSREAEIPFDMVYPCFIKPLRSIEGNKTEMTKADNADELRKCLNKLRQEDSDRAVLVQRYLNIEKEYDIGGVCIDDKVIIPGMIEKIRVAQFERGVTLAGRMVSCEPLGETFDRICEMMRSFHYTGLFDLELILSGGELYLNEVNFRAGGPNYSYTLNGNNLPAMLIGGILGDVPETADQSFRGGRTFVYEKVAWEEYIQGFMTKKELKETIEGADMRLLSNSDDPGPGKIFEKRIRLSMLKHKLLRR